VPTDDGLRPHQHEVSAPIVAETTGEDPQELVPASDLRSGLGAERNRELVAQEEVLDDQVAAALEGRAE